MSALRSNPYVALISKAGSIGLSLKVVVGALIFQGLRGLHKRLTSAFCKGHACPCITAANLQTMKIRPWDLGVGMRDEDTNSPHIMDFP